MYFDAIDPAEQYMPGYGVPPSAGPQFGQQVQGGRGVPPMGVVPGALSPQGVPPQGGMPGINPMTLMSIMRMLPGAGGASGGAGGMAANAGGPMTEGLGGGSLAGAGGGGMGAGLAAAGPWAALAAAAAITDHMVEGSPPNTIPGVVDVALGPSPKQWKTNPGLSAWQVLNPIGGPAGSALGGFLGLDFLRNGFGLFKS